MSDRSKWALLFALVALLAPFAAAEDKAEELYRRYRALRLKEDYSTARFRILRSLGEVDTPTSRQVLLKILKSTRSGDERVICCHSLGKVADLETARDWLKWVSKKSDPVLYQALTDGLAATTRLEVHGWICAEAFAGARPQLECALAEALVVLELPDAAETLRRLWARTSVRQDQVATAAAVLRALGRIGQATEFLPRAATHPAVSVRAAAAAVWPLLKSPPPELHELMADSSARVRREAVAAIGEAKREAFVPDLIHLLETDARLRNRYTAYVALKRISGRDFSFDTSTWRAWWKDRENQDPNAFPTPRKYTYARYYGFGVFTDRVVFVVDVSGSMNWSFHKTPKRIEVARRELARVIHELTPKSLFNVVVYSTKVKAWQPKEAEANPKNVSKALQWAERALADPDGDTHTFEALEDVFAHNPQFDTVFFLSDGWPSHGDYTSNEGIIAAVRTWNRERGATLNTIALTLENVDRGHPQSSTAKLNEMKAFLRQLAAATGGECKAITNG